MEVLLKKDPISQDKKDYTTNTIPVESVIFTRRPFNNSNKISELEYFYYLVSVQCGIDPKELSKIEDIIEESLNWN